MACSPMIPTESISAISGDKIRLIKLMKSLAVNIHWMPSTVISNSIYYKLVQTGFAHSGLRVKS